MSTTSTNLGLTLAEGSDVVDVDAHIASNFSTLDSKWSSAGNPQAVQVGGSGTPGSSTVVARSDHVHGATTGTPVSIGTTNSAGSNATVAASDHIHKIDNGSITTALIADSNVTTAKIADSNVTTAKIADSNVTTAKLADDAITEPKLADRTVWYTKLIAIDGPSDNDVLTFDAASSQFEWQSASALVDTAIDDGSITRAKLEAVLRPPYGMIQMFGGSSATAPNAAGWLLCNGQSVSRATYADLFTAIGTTYGAGDGSTTFDLPDLRERFPLGVGPSFALGTEGGATTKDLSHTHSGPSHTHGASALGVSGNTGAMNAAGSVVQGGGGVNVGSHTHDQGTLDVTGSTDAGGTAATGSGGSATQSILNPYQTVHFYIYAGVAS